VSIAIPVSDKCIRSDDDGGSSTDVMDGTSRPGDAMCVMTPSPEGSDLAAAVAEISSDLCRLLYITVTEGKDGGLEYTVRSSRGGTALTKEKGALAVVGPFDSVTETGDVRDMLRKDDRVTPCGDLRGCLRRCRYSVV